MCFDEFKTLLGGLNGDTPLGAVVRIRSEKNRKVLEGFTPEQRRIRADWAKFRAGNPAGMTADSTAYKEAMKGFAAMFRSLAN